MDRVQKLGIIIIINTIPSSEPSRTEIKECFTYKISSLDSSTFYGIFHRLPVLN